MTLQTERLRMMEQIRAFVEGCESVDYKPRDRACAYAFVRRTDCVRYEGDLVDGKLRGRSRARTGRYRPVRGAIAGTGRPTGARMSRYASLDGSGRVFGWRSDVDLQAAGWIVWAPGGGWRVSPAGRAYIERLLAAYTRADADRDLARSRCAGSGGGEYGM